MLENTLDKCMRNAAKQATAVRLKKFFFFKLTAIDRRIFYHRALDFTGRVYAYEHI